MQMLPMETMYDVEHLRAEVLANTSEVEDAIPMVQMTKSYMRAYGEGVYVVCP